LDKKLKSEDFTIDETVRSSGVLCNKWNGSGVDATLTSRSLLKDLAFGSEEST
jgi:hypothetical protein